MTDTEIAYLAGLIDGDGTVSIQSDRGKWYPTVSIANTDRRALEWCKDLYGSGSISDKKKYKEHHKQSYNLRWIYDNALKVAEDCLPYLIIKKRRAQLLAQWKNCTPRNGRYTDDMWQKKLALIKEVKRLNKRGTR